MRRTQLTILRASTRRSRAAATCPCRGHGPRRSQARRQQERGSCDRKRSDWRSSSATNAAFDELQPHWLISPRVDRRTPDGALASLLGASDSKLAPVLHRLLAEAALRGPAIRGLAAYDDPKTPRLILAAYSPG